MHYINGIENYDGKRPSAVTLGKFDGLHKGHELLISRICSHQAQDNVSGIVVAFDMSPLYADRHLSPDLLLTSREKAALLEGRVDYFIDCPFVKEISGMPAEEFIRKVLVKTLHAKYVVIGTDFRFGHNKKGDPKILKEYGSIYGYEVEVVEKLKYRGRDISSSLIRETLKKGDYDLAGRLLGYDYEEMKKNFDKHSPA